MLIAALRRLVRLLACRHRDMVRIHVGGVWYFACDCGYLTPVMRRDPPKGSAPDA